MSSTESPDAVEQAVDDPRPECTVHLQCPDKDFRGVAAAVVKPTYEPCGNPECFDGEEPEDDTTVVVARGRAHKKMHRKRGASP